MDTLLPTLKTVLGDAVSDIRSTDRLVSSAMVLSAPEGGPDLQLRKLMQRSGQDIPDVTPVLELNPAHPIVHALAQKCRLESRLMHSLISCLMSPAFRMAKHQRM